MTEEEKLALIEMLEELSRYGGDCHPALARALNRLRQKLGLYEQDYGWH